MGHMSSSYAICPSPWLNSEVPLLIYFSPTLSCGIYSMQTRTQTSSHVSKMMLMQEERKKKRSRTPQGHLWIHETACLLCKWEVKVHYQILILVRWWEAEKIDASKSVFRTKFTCHHLGEWGARFWLTCSSVQHSHFLNLPPPSQPHGPILNLSFWVLKEK